MHKYQNKRALINRLVLLQFFSFMLVCFSTNTVLLCQNNTFLSGAREAGLANAGVAISKEWAMFHNPASLSSVDKNTIGIHYSNAFSLPELSVASLSGVMPISPGTFGVSVSYFGTALYNEQKYAVGYAQKIGDKISAGINIDYYGVNLPENYESDQTIAGEIGLLIQPIDNLNIGCHLNNVTNQNFSTYKSENIPTYFALGAAWVADFFLLTSQLNVYKQSSSVISVGSEFIIAEGLAIRAGASNDERQKYTFGLGYTKKRIGGDIAFAHHPYLGISSFLSITISLSN